MSPWLIQTFLRSLPRMLPRRRVPSKHCASRRPLLEGEIDGQQGLACFVFVTSGVGPMKDLLPPRWIELHVCLVDDKADARSQRGEERNGDEIHSPKHLHDLCILLAILLEGKLTLLVVVLVLSTSSVLSSLSLVLGHICGLVLNSSCCLWCVWIEDVVAEKEREWVLDCVVWRTMGCLEMLIKGTGKMMAGVC